MLMLQKGGENMTRKLSELHINKVIDAINEGTLVRVAIYKKQNGVHMIDYSIDSDRNLTRKTQSCVQLMRLLNIVKEHISNKTLVEAKIEFDVPSDNIKMQLEFKSNEQG